MSAPGSATICAQLARQCDVRLVGRHHEAGVLKLVELLTHASDDARRPVAGVEAADPAAEVEEHVAVDVDETCPLGALEEEAVPRLGNSGGDETPALLDQSPAARPG